MRKLNVLEKDQVVKFILPFSNEVAHVHLWVNNLFQHLASSMPFSHVPCSPFLLKKKRKEKKNPFAPLIVFVSFIIITLQCPSFLGPSSSCFFLCLLLFNFVCFNIYPLIAYVWIRRQYAYPPSIETYRS